LKIRMLVGGHTTQTYELERAKAILRHSEVLGYNIIDDETHQLAKIESLTEESKVTVWPSITGG